MHRDQVKQPYIRFYRPISSTDRFCVSDEECEISFFFEKTDVMGASMFEETDAAKTRTTPYLLLQSTHRNRECCPSGCTIAVTPAWHAFSAASLQEKGKNASLANTAPWSPSTINAVFSWGTDHTSHPSSASVEGYIYQPSSISGETECGLRLRSRQVCILRSPWRCLRLMPNRTPTRSAPVKS